MPWVVLPGVALAVVVILVLGSRPGKRPSGSSKTRERVAAVEAARPPPALAPPADVDEIASAADIASAEGAAFVVDGAGRRRAAAGGSVPSGAGVVTNGGASRAAIAFGRGARIELGGDTVVARIATSRAAGGDLAFVARGRVTGVAPERSAARPLLLSTPHLDLAASGARFTVDVDRGATRVFVQEGRVRLSGAAEGPPVTVGREHYALADGTGRLVTAPQPRGTALFVVGAATLSTADAQVRARLEGLGLDVKIVVGGAPPENDPLGAALVLISATASARDVGARYRELAVPLITWEAYVLDDLGMTGPAANVEMGVSRTRGRAVVADPAHPLAGGLTGTVQLLSRPGPEAGQGRPPRWRTSWGIPGPAADAIATLPDLPSKAAVFAYERGAPMPGLGAAPARRVSLFMHDGSAPYLTEAGWALFDVAVRWCQQDARGP
jgi:hypothetical protein